MPGPCQNLATALPKPCQGLARTFAPFGTFFWGYFWIQTIFCSTPNQEISSVTPILLAFPILINHGGRPAILTHTSHQSPQASASVPNRSKPAKRTPPVGQKPPHLCSALPHHHTGDISCSKRSINENVDQSTGNCGINDLSSRPSGSRGSSNCARSSFP